MRTRATINFDWLHLGFSLVILSSLILYWVGMWAYNEFQIDQQVQIFFLIIPSLFGVLAAFAITPNVPDSGQLDLREYYLVKRMSIFLPFAAYFVTALLADFVIIGIENVTIEAATPHIVGSALIGLLLLTKEVWIHIAVLVFWIVELIWSLLESAW